MYCVHVMYPRTENVAFDLEHYLNVHVPMGLGLLWKHCGVKPAEFILSDHTFGPDRTEEGSDFFIISSMFFAAKEEATAFIDLFEMEEPAAMLQADWPKFTEADPVVVLGQSSRLEADDYIAKSETVIREAAAES